MREKFIVVQKFAENLKTIMKKIHVIKEFEEETFNFMIDLLWICTFLLNSPYNMCT